MKTVETKESKKNVITRLVYNWRFLLYFGLNQLGSLLFQIFIGYVNLGVGSVVSNGMALFVAYLIEVLIGVNKITIFGVLGFFFFTLGLTFIFSE